MTDRKLERREIKVCGSTKEAGPYVILFIVNVAAYPAVLPQRVQAYGQKDAGKLRLVSAMFSGDGADYGVPSQG